jgi:hypothetical protein
MKTCRGPHVVYSEDINDGCASAPYASHISHNGVDDVKSCGDSIAVHNFTIL